MAYEAKYAQRNTLTPTPRRFGGQPPKWEGRPPLSKNIKYFQNICSGSVDMAQNVSEPSTGRPPVPPKPSIFGRLVWANHQRLRSANFFACTCTSLVYNKIFILCLQVIHLAINNNKKQAKWPKSVKEPHVYDVIAHVTHDFRPQREVNSNLWFLLKLLTPKISCKNFQLDTREILISCYMQNMAKQDISRAQKVHVRCLWQK